MSQNRIRYYDFLRCFAIILVIAVHSFSGAFADRNLSLLGIALRNLCNVAVPIFLALSGFFMASKQAESANYFFLLKKQIIRVWIPVVFYSLPLFVLDIMHGRTIVKSLTNLCICGYSVYYFVAVIIQCYLLLPLLNHLYSNKNHHYRVLILLTLIVSIIGWSVVTYVFTKQNITLPLILYAGGVWMWFCFFALGFYIGKENAYGSLKLWKISTLLTFILCIIESLFLIIPGQLNGLGQKPTTMLFSFCFIPLLLSERVKFFFESIQSRIFDFFAKIGFYSFGIYLIHCYILMFLKSYVRKYLQIFCEQNGFIQWMLLIVITLFVSFSILWICKRLFPRFTRLFLGV
jgi:peptidoglycan/LPS O-acetylase OafA/YrhL